MFGQPNDQQNQTHDDSAAGAPMPTAVIDELANDGGESVPVSVPSMVTSSFDPASIPGSPSDQPAPTTSNDGGANPVANDDLLNIKQEALQHLNPLVGHLEQSPEEKFRTTMMMIQASDNQELIKDAFESAKQITDDKIRAQALLDIINEINYFTQQHSN